MNSDTIDESDTRERKTDPGELAMRNYALHRIPFPLEFAVDIGESHRPVPFGSLIEVRDDLLNSQAFEKPHSLSRRFDAAVWRRMGENTEDRQQAPLPPFRTLTWTRAEPGLVQLWGDPVMEIALVRGSTAVLLAVAESLSDAGPFAILDAESRIYTPV